MVLKAGSFCIKLAIVAHACESSVLSDCSSLSKRFKVCAAPSSKLEAWAKRLYSVLIVSHSSLAGLSAFNSSNCHSRRWRTSSCCSRFILACWYVCKAACQVFQDVATCLTCSWCLPCASNICRWALGFNKSWWACWPWISIKNSATSRNWVKVAGEPLIKALLLPARSITRRSTNSLSSSSCACNHSLVAWLVSNTALIVVLSAPSRI